MNFNNCSPLILLIVLTLGGCGLKTSPSFGEAEKIPLWEERFLKEKIPQKKIPMALILALGSNLGNRLDHLTKARNDLAHLFEEKGASCIYESKAVDYIQQPSFLNQVIEYKIPSITPWQVLDATGGIETQFGRTRHVPKGPRTLDIDIIFFGQREISSERLQIPHPRWQERSFVYWPLHDLPGFAPLKIKFFRREAEVPKDITPIMAKP